MILFYLKLSFKTKFHTYSCMEGNFFKLLSCQSQIKLCHMIAFIFFSMKIYFHLKLGGLPGKATIYATAAKIMSNN